MSERNPTDKTTDLVIAETSQEWRAWANIGVVALLLMPVCVIGVFLSHENNNVLALFGASAIILLVIIIIAFKNGTGAADSALLMIRQLPAEDSTLSIFIEREAEGPDKFFALIKSQNDSSWLQLTVLPGQRKLLLNLRPNEEVPVSVKRSAAEEGPILVAYNGIEFTAWKTNSPY